MTLRQLVGSFNEKRPLDDLATNAVASEERRCCAAPALNARSYWTAVNVAADYSVDPSSVHVLLRGVNLDRAASARWERTEGQRRRYSEGRTRSDGLTTVHRLSAPPTTSARTAPMQTGRDT
jgi:hypothetical protein